MIRSFLRMLVALVSAAAAVAVVVALLKRAVPSVGGPESDEIGLAVIGEAKALESHATAFRGGSCLTVMGATRLDLRRATPAPGGARLKIQAVMSAVKVLVPEGWLVRCDIPSASAAVVNRTARAGEQSDAEPDLVLSGTAVASALAIAHQPEESPA